MRANATASPESAAMLAGNLEVLEHDMSADQLAPSEALLATLPH